MGFEEISIFLKERALEKPHLVVHVQLPKSEAEFDNILGFCLGENHWCDYIEGNLSFMCVVAGFNAAELTPKYPDFIKERVYALYDAVYWWNEYGSECLKSNEKLLKKKKNGVKFTENERKWFHKLDKWAKI